MTQFERELLRIHAVEVALLATIGSALVVNAPEEYQSASQNLFLGRY